MMYQCLSQMPLKALGNLPLCSVALLQQPESTTDAVRRFSSKPAFVELLHEAGLF